MPNLYSYRDIMKYISELVTRMEADEISIRKGEALARIAKYSAELIKLQNEEKEILLMEKLSTELDQLKGGINIGKENATPDIN